MSLRSDIKNRSVYVICIIPDDILDRGQDGN